LPEPWQCFHRCGKTLRRWGLVPEEYAREYHAVLDRLEKIGISVAEYRIPDSAVQPKLTQTVFGEGGKKNYYSQEKYVAEPFVLTKMDALLGYFEIITSEKPGRIGFHPPEKK